MQEFIEVMWAPFTACALLTLIHAYLGFHVVSRGVIFVDLAMAQMAALGSTLGVLVGFSLHSIESFLTAFAMTVFGACLLTAARRFEKQVPVEALIGILYAVAGGATILALSSSAEASEELRSILVGHLLFVSSSELWVMLTIYASVGLAHCYFREGFLSASRAATCAETSSTARASWDFFFYLTLGLVVTSSVEIAGVLLVFCFLVVPAVCGALLAHSLRSRLIAGWLLSFVAALVGVVLSYVFDLPTGATIVCVFGLTTLISLLYAGSRGAQCSP